MTIGLRWQPAAIGNWPAAARPLEPFTGFNFAVEIEGLIVGGFTSVEGLESELRTIEFREGGVNGYVHRLPDGANASTIVLRHGLTANISLWTWYDNTVRGAVQRRNGTIALLDRQGVPLVWWNFRRALPVRWSGPALAADSDAIAVESIELAHEGLSMPLAGQALAAAQAIAGMGRS